MASVALRIRGNKCLVTLRCTTYLIVAVSHLFQLVLIRHHRVRIHESDCRLVLALRLLVLPQVGLCSNAFLLQDLLLCDIALANDVLQLYRLVDLLAVCNSLSSHRIN